MTDDFSISVAASLLRHLTQSPRKERSEREDPRAESDAQYRDAYGATPFGAKPRAPFYSVIGESPAGKYVGRDDAAAFVLKIERALDMPDWTAKERGRLMTLRKKWSRRANGEDARFAKYGTAPGRAPKSDRTTAADVLIAIKSAISESGGQIVQDRVKYTNEWPLGKPVERR